MSLSKSILVVAVACVSASPPSLFGQSAIAGKVVRFRSQASRRTTGQIEVDTQADGRRVNPPSHARYVPPPITQQHTQRRSPQHVAQRLSPDADSEHDAQPAVAQPSKPPWYSARRWMLSIPPIRRRIEGHDDRTEDSFTPIQQAQAFSFSSDDVPPAPLSEQGEPPLPTAAEPQWPVQFETQWPASADAEWYPQSERPRYPVVDEYRYPVEDERSHMHRLSDHMHHTTYDWRLCHQEKCQRLHGDSYYDPIAPHTQPAYGHHQTNWRRFPEQCQQCSPVIVKEPVIGQEPAVRQRIVHVTVSPTPPQLPPLPAMRLRPPALELPGEMQADDPLIQTSRRQPVSHDTQLNPAAQAPTLDSALQDKVPERALRDAGLGPDFQAPGLDPALHNASPDRALRDVELDPAARVPAPDPALQDKQPHRGGPVIPDREIMRFDLVRPIGDGWDVECFNDDWDNLESFDAGIRGVSAEVPQKEVSPNVVPSFDRNDNLVGPNWETDEGDYELQDDDWSDLELTPLP